MAAPWSFVVLDWLVRIVAYGATSCGNAWPTRCGAISPCGRCVPVLFFTAAGNVLPTYVLPGYPPRAARRCCFGPVASGEGEAKLDRAENARWRSVFSLAVGFPTLLVTQQQRIDHGFAQRALVRVYDAERTDPLQRLVYLNDEPVSAEFYTNGKAEKIRDFAVLATYLTDATSDFFVIREGDLAQLPPPDRARLAPLADFGKYRLFREAPRDANFEAVPREVSPR
jgi:hypothetical protein